MRAKVIFITVLLLLLATAPFTFALSITEIDINVSPIFFIGSSPPAGYGGPSPILQTFGASMVLSLSGPWYMEPSIEFFGTYYEWTGGTDPNTGRAVPTGYETGAGFFTAGSLIALQFGAMFPVTSFLSLGGSVGPDFMVRFPLELTNNSSLSIAGRGPATSYFYSSLRFLLPETRFIVRWQVVDAVGLVFSLRALFPIFHLWDGEGLPFTDQFSAAFTIGFVIRVGGKPAAAAPAASEAPADEQAPAAQPAPPAPDAPPDVAK
jgi:hypothetical protein